MRQRLFLTALALCLTFAAAPAHAAATRAVTDMAGRTVTIPVDPKRIVTISDGFVESVIDRKSVV